MPTLLERAQKREKKAMQEVYERTKRPVYFICQYSLGDERGARMAAAKVYESLWKELPEHLPENWKALELLLAEKAGNACAGTLPSEALNADTLPEELRLLSALSGRQRAVFLLRMAVQLPAERTARALKLNSSVAEAAWNQAEQSAKRYFAKQDEAPRATAYLQMQAALREAASKAEVPAMLDETVQEGIDAAAVAQKHGRRWLLVAIAAVLVAALGVGAWAIFGQNKDDTETAEHTDNWDNSQNASTSTDTSEAELHHAEIEVEGYGTISVALNATAAPESTANFIKLAEEGFYDGLTFHRIIEGFMIQGGDPNGNGTGGSDETITGEFSDNGFDNPLSHTRGAISMARSSDYNSASSQFFIVQQDSTSLDGQYAVFGYVTDGMDIVDQICEDANPTDNNGTIPADEQPVITTIRIID